MPSPSGPNAHPSAPGNYPGAPNQWMAGASLSSSSSASGSGTNRLAARATASSSSTAAFAGAGVRPAASSTVSPSSAAAVAFVVVPGASSMSATSFLATDFGTLLSSSSRVVADGFVRVFGRVIEFSASSLEADGAAVAPVGGLLLSAGSSVTANAFPAQSALANLSDTSRLRADGRFNRVAAVLLAGSSDLDASATSFTPAFPSPGGTPIPQVKVPKLTLLVADTVTGKVAYSAPFTDLSWSQPINKEGTASATLVVQDVLESVYEQGDRDPATTLNEFLTGPYRYSLAVAYGAVVLWAGPYLPSSDPPDAPTVSIAGASFRRMMDRRIVRKLNGTGDPGDASRDLTFFTTAQGAALQLVQNAVAGTDDYGRTRLLPVTCSVPPDTRGDEVFTYLSYDVITTQKALADLSSRAGDGPDIRFDPYLYEGNDGSAYLAYDLKIGGPTIDGYGPAGPYGPLPWVWDDGLHPISRDVDAVGLATSVWATGSGQDRAKLIATASNDYLPSLGWPVLEVAQTGQQSENDKNKLNLYAAGAVGSDPAVTWKASMQYDSDPPVGVFREGDLARIDVRRHPLIRPGPYERRITQVGGNATNVNVSFDLDE